MYQVILRRQEYPTPEITIFCVSGAGRNTSLQRFRIMGWPDKRLKSAKGPLPSAKKREVNSRKKYYALSIVFNGFSIEMHWKSIEPCTIL